MKKIKLKDKVTATIIDKVLKSLADGVVLIPTEYNYVFASNDQKRLLSLNQTLAPFLTDSQKMAPAKFLLKSDIDFDSLNESAQKIISHFFPGPLIALLSHSGIRVTNSPLINSLLKRLAKPVYFIEKEDTDSVWLRKWEDFIVLSVAAEIKKPILSTVVDLSVPIPTVVRKGAIPILEIENLLGRRIKLSKDIYFSVLFVCTGNSCRSPMAKGILDKMLEKKNVLVYSAGTVAGIGSLPSEFAVRAVQKYGADISHHLSASLTKELINGADLILVMSPKHKESVVNLVSEAKSKTFLLKEYAFGSQEEVEDPIGAPLEVFEKVAAEINESLEKVAQDIKERLN